LLEYYGYDPVAFLLNKIINAPAEKLINVSEWAVADIVAVGIISYLLLRDRGKRKVIAKLIQRLIDKCPIS